MVIFILVLLGAFLLLYFIALKQKRDINKQIRKPDTKIVSRSGLRESKYTGELFSGSTTTEDHLGKAAELKKNAKVAIKNKLFDEAWKLLQKQKMSYMKHTNNAGFTAKQVLALDATVHVDLANILRMENKHTEALIHIVYWVANNYDNMTKTQEQKLTAYFNRSNLKLTSIEEAKIAISSLAENPEYVNAQELVSIWVAKEDSISKEP
ncbi:hypothetical protein [Pseudoalteromonas sp. S3431]|uniref:hypothetical protein n=1 Tax=Pseudoalteromonas sp. S3431 TaxID=579537 RepID=UPI0004A02C6B|nr:hypothetical protein [Pseudoalteromonas sp. S3431]KDC55095.1 hypothetical protein DO88_05480 [Pseudoalteromonas sp. S3431]